MADYIGPERRRDHMELEEALATVQRLHGAVNTLATAVTNTVPRAELDALRNEVRRDYLIKLYFMGGFSGLIVVILMFFINLKIDNAVGAARHDHAVTACLLAQPEASRTGSLSATALVTCQQTVRP